MTEPELIRPEPGPDAGIDELQTDIDQTRKELGETVEALTAKMDVEGQGETKEQGRRDQGGRPGQGRRDQGGRPGQGARSSARDDRRRPGEGDSPGGRSGRRGDGSAGVAPLATTLSGYALLGTAVTSPPSMMNSLPVA